jgi:cyclopropane fatty-acyl-phospholipid synthase-like methyltransferase
VNFNTHSIVKIAKRYNVEAWLYSFVYREFRKISKNYGVRLTTNNYGYYPTEIDDYNKYQLQMYDEYADLIGEVGAEQVLEIGSGAGGGLMHMQSRLPQAHFTGLDSCKEAVKKPINIFSVSNKNASGSTPTSMTYLRTAKNLMPL